MQMYKYLHPRNIWEQQLVLIWVKIVIYSFAKHPRAVNMCIFTERNSGIQVFGTDKFRKSLVKNLSRLWRGKNRQVDELVTIFRQEPDKFIKTGVFRVSLRDYPLAITMQFWTWTVIWFSARINKIKCLHYDSIWLHETRIGFCIGNVIQHV